MKKFKIIHLSLVFLCLGLFSVYAQETPEKIRTDILKKKPAVYDPAGRRDPFRDMLAGSAEERYTRGGISQMSIDDIVLIGIAKVRGNYTAIINGPQGFPYSIRVGNKFADGHVLSLDGSKVIFRKTKDRGVPLYRPRNITKEISPEER
jgi:Tfp pilus assembly protein PilP